MNVRIRTRQLVVTLASLVAILFVVSFVQSLTPHSKVASSSEAGFVSFSPRGASGGVIIPASCESGIEHSAGECVVVSGSGGPAYTLTASPSSVITGETITATWTAPSSSSATDWVALFLVGNPNTSYGAWIYTGGAISGTFPTPAPSPGIYEFRYLLNDEYVDVKRSNPVTVSSPPLPDLTAAKPTFAPTSVSVGQSISLTSLISNIGSASASGSFPNIFRVSTSTTELVSGSTISGLAAGASANTTASFIPKFADSYTVSACADNNTDWVGNISESNEDNNCSADADATFTATACTTSLSASPSTIDQGEQSTLSWSPSSSFCGFTSCTFVDLPSSPFSGASGTRPVSPPTTTPYGISCVGPYGTTPSANTTVTVIVPTVSISATPNRVRKGGTTTVSWNATDVNSCTITRNGIIPTWGGPLVPDPLDLSRTVSDSQSDTITVQTTYTISCANDGSTTAVTATKIVNVLSAFEEF